MISPIFFGNRSSPCGDCSNGYCTMNCGPRIEPDRSLICLPKLKKPFGLPTETKKAS